jgi:hypothetical protein
MGEYQVLTRLDSTLHVDHGRCNLIVLHSMECPEQPGRALSWAQYLHATNWMFFAQDYYDPVDHVRVVHDLDVKVAHCGNGNQYGGARTIGREHAMYAGQANAPADSMLLLSARDTRADCERWDIPMEFVDGPGLLAGRRGITTHDLCSRYLHGSTHTDPTPTFNVPHYIDLVRGDHAPAPAPKPAPKRSRHMAYEEHPNTHHLEMFDCAFGQFVSKWQDPEHPEKWSGWQPIASDHNYTEVLGSCVKGGAVNVAVRYDDTAKGGGQGELAWWFDDKGWHAVATA